MDSIVTLKEWGLNKGGTLKYLYNVIISGKKQSGKTTMVIDVLHHLHKVGIKRAVVFTDTVHRSIYSNHFRNGHICDSNNVIKKLEKLFHFQEHLVMKKKLGLLPRNKNLDLVVVLDACKDQNIFRSEIIRHVFMDGSRYGIKMVITVQHHMLLKPSIRGNCDYFIQLNEATKEVSLSLYRFFFDIFENSSQFRNCLKNFTQDFTGLIVDRTCYPRDIGDCVTFYKAKQGRKFMFGKGDWSRRRCLIIPRNMKIPQIGILGFNDDIFREIVGYL